jgi:hypothetical protein
MARRYAQVVKATGRVMNCLTYGDAELPEAHHAEVDAQGLVLVEVDRALYDVLVRDGHLYRLTEAGELVKVEEAEG